jgi:ABC-2 type transport system permease protein
MNMIEVKNLTKKFGEVTAVENLTFDVAEGEVFGLLGPNGAGKTTTVRMLCCLISRTSGEARIAGYQIGKDADSLPIRKLIGLVPDNVGLYEELSAYENLDYYGKLYECSEGERKTKIEVFLKMMDLWEKRDQPVSGYSKGMKQKVAIARAKKARASRCQRRRKQDHFGPGRSAEGKSRLDTGHRFCRRPDPVRHPTQPWPGRDVHQDHGRNKMRLSKAWIVASKDFKTFAKRKSIFYSILYLEGVISIGLPIILRFIANRTGAAALLPSFMNAFSFWFVIGASLLPVTIASYSLIGEKVQKSLEPLLATPTTDEEILAGKSIAAFLPAIFSDYIGALIFMVLADLLTYHTLRYLYYPNWDIAIILLLLAPLACLLAVGYNVLISSRATDARSAQQLGLLILLPFGLVYVLSEIRVLALPDRDDSLWPAGDESQRDLLAQKNSDLSPVSIQRPA